MVNYIYRCCFNTEMTDAPLLAYERELSMTHKIVGGVMSEVQTELAARPRLLAKSDTLLKSIAFARDSTKRLTGAEETLAEEPKKEMHRIYLAHFNDILASLEARVLLQSVQFRPTPELFFQLSCQAEGINPTRIGDMVAAHQRAVRDYFEAEASMTPGSFLPFERLDYRDHATRINVELAQLASRIFGTQLSIRLDVNEKERSPNNFLGWVNVGFQPLAVELVATLAHEGAFGHQAHAQLSQEYFLNFRFLPALEGLAVLGERIGIDEYFANFPTENGHTLGEARIRNRRVNDTFGAALETLRREGASIATVSRLLSSPFYSEDLIRNSLEAQRFDKPSARFVQPGNISYTMGYDLLSRVYARVLAVAEEAGLDEERRRALVTRSLRVMYSGMRSPNTISREVNLSVARDLDYFAKEQA